jgi:hypothetical protein
VLGFGVISGVFDGGGSTSDGCVSSGVAGLKCSAMGRTVG